MATKRKAKAKSPAKSEGPTVYYQADAHADAVKATAMNAPADSPLTGYETLDVRAPDGVHASVPGGIGGPGESVPRWHLVAP